MYSSEPAFLLGFHGCDASVANKVVAGSDDLKSTNKNNVSASQNDYHWLGHGIYFWENNPARALEYAKFLKEHPERSKNPIQEPAIIGAIIDTGFSLNLLESRSLRILKQSYELLKEAHKVSRTPMPKNLAVGGSKDLLLRKLDCAVIETTHAYNDLAGQQPYDTVRGVFVEGDKLYEDSGFNERNHIQICVRNPNCIKGYFLPRKQIKGYSKP